MSWGGYWIMSVLPMMAMHRSELLEISTRLTTSLQWHSLGYAENFLKAIPWFKDATFEPMDVIPCFLYQALKWKDQHVFCHGDSAHLQKSWVDQERSGIRWMKVAGVWVIIVGGIPGGFLGKAPWISGVAQRRPKRSLHSNSL